MIAMLLGCFIPMILVITLLFFQALRERQKAQSESLRYTAQNISLALDRYAAGVDKPSASFPEDLAKTREVLANYSTYDMLGGMLLVDGNIVGFSLGEIVGDTLFTHIEKADRDYLGCYQMVVAQFAQQFAHEGVHFINREDDAGDPGLRTSKLSYHPVTLLEKYTVTVDEPCKFCALAE